MKITKAHLVATAKDINALIQPEDNPFKPTAKTTAKETEEWIKEAVTVLEPEDAEVLKSATLNVLKEMGLTDWMEEIPTDKSEEKKAEKKSEKKSEKSGKKLTKKQVVIDMISTKTGATIEQIAQEIEDKKIDSDFSKNCTVVKLWLSKMGFDTKKKAIEANPIFKTH